MLKSVASVLVCAAAIAATAAPAEAASQRVSGRVGQFARWRDSICVHVDGLAFDQAAKIAARVGDVAKAVGVNVQPAGCANANIEVEFTGQPQTLLDQIAVKRPQLLGYHYSVETKKLKTVTYPIQAWYMTATVGTGPSSAGATFSAAGSVSTNGTNKSEVIDDPNNPPPTGCADSRLSTCLNSVYKNVLVTADTDHLSGKDLGLLSDYIALVALSRPASLDGCAADPSVLDVLAPKPCGRDAPTGLTPADAASITALYAADVKGLKASEQSELDTRMQGILSKAKK